MKKYSLLTLLIVWFCMCQTSWGQFAIQVIGTDGSVVIDTLTLANDPAATAGFDSLSPSLHEFEIPVAAKGLDFRVASNFPQDVLGLGAYTSVHHMSYSTQTDKWKLQFNVDSGRTSMMIQWPAGLSGVGGGIWKLVQDDADVITFADVDMTTSTSVSIPVEDIESHTFYIITGDKQKYRSFSYADVLGAVDSKGKKGKGEARKAYASEGTFHWTNALGHATDGLHLEWSQGITEFPLSISPPGTMVWLDEPKHVKGNITFTSPLPDGAPVTIYAIGNKGKALQVKKWYWVTAAAIDPPKAKNPPVDPTGGLLRYHMPNINNIGEEAYSQIVFTPTGLVIGNTVDQSGLTVKLKPLFRAVIHGKWKDVLKTLSDKTGIHTGGPFCLEFFATAKPIEKVQKTLPPAKHNNKLLAEAIVLKFNIGAGEAGKIEEGGTSFGNLLYVPQPGDPAIPAGQSVIAIAAKLDSVMRCLHTSWDAPGPVDFNAWYAVASRINGSFSGPFDTVGFVAPVPPPHVKTAGTVAKGTKAIMDVPFLYRTSFAENVPTYNAPDIAKLESINNPDEYSLHQNYPNPFNPMTNIEFAIPEDGMVTMKVYNVLGQEVATLIDNELMTSGTNEVTFDATGLASGVYYYKINVNQGQFQKVMKMMLVK